MDPGAYVFASLDPANFRNREWRRILARAGMGQRALKDLRDSFASHLLTAGVQLGYLSLALGHADVAVTARHYARWAGGDVYREPLALEWGEVPPDLLARLGESHQSPTSNETAAGSDSLTDGRVEGFWGERGVSNPRPPGPQPGALTN